MIGGLVTRHTITRERPVMVDDGRGGTDADYSATVAVPLEGWALDAGNTLEDVQNRDGVLIQWTARGPFDADVQYRDRITVFGEQFHIDGGVVRQPGPTPRTSHTILLLRRWEG